MSILKNLPSKVKIVEVGPRDGLQNESEVIETKDKLQYIKLLIEAGIKSMEVCSFVRAEKIPQMADSEELYKNISALKNSNVNFSTLVPNLTGMERAQKLGVKEIALFTATSETFNQRNINATIDDSLQRLSEVSQVANKESIKIRGYVSTVFGCPYEGKTSVDKLLFVIEKLLSFGAYEVSLGDTIGVGVPSQVENILERVLKEFPKESIAMHFHDTRGMALTNILTSLLMGIKTFDSSSGGLGGCPYAVGSSGNVATEDVLYLMNSLGIDTGIDMEKLAKASEFILNKINKNSPSKYLTTLLSGK